LPQPAQGKEMSDRDDFIRAKLREIADARANWMEDCIAGLMINGVSKDRIEIQHRPSKTVIAVDGVPKYEFEFKA